LPGFWTFSISFFRALPPRGKRILLAFIVFILLTEIAVWFVFHVSDDEIKLTPLQILNIQEYSRFKSAKTGAEKGDAQALYEMATMYRSGAGVSKNYNKAVKSFIQSAKQGHTQSQYVLGTLYDKGEGVPQSYARAAEWYEIAAHIGNHMEAQYALANFYFNGRGVPHDYLMAIKWYRKAAGKGHPTAQYLLGTFYAEGWGVERDFLEAYIWFSLAARKADQVKAEKFSYNPVQSLKTLKLKMTEVQINSAERALAEWQADK